MHLRMARSSGTGTSGRYVEIGGGPCVAMFTHSSGRLAPRKGAVPAKSSYKITPIAQISVRSSTSRDEFICSGDMYLGDPSTFAVVVMPASDSEKLCALTLETPKSRTLT